MSVNKHDGEKGGELRRARVCLSFLKSFLQIDNFFDAGFKEQRVLSGKVNSSRSISKTMVSRELGFLVICGFFFSFERLAESTGLFQNIKKVFPSLILERTVYPFS